MLKFWLNLLLVVALITLTTAFFIYLYNPHFKTSPLEPINSLIQGLISALIFLVLIFYLIKPSIKIADHLAESPDEQPHLRIKVVNCSLFRAYDLNVSFSTNKGLAYLGLISFQSYYAR
jgi:hypothetical protein